MKFFANLLIFGLATQVAVASTWLGKAHKAVYNNWHETELERWLSDHGIPYPAPADRKDLEDLVKNNWDSVVRKPGAQASKSTVDTYEGMKNWMFDAWTDSQLKLFLDKHQIPAPQPRKRDTLLKTVRENYEAIAQKLGESIHYPGDWLYETWTESDLKRYLDERGIPVPQPTSRDRLIAAVRRNVYVAGQTAGKQQAAFASKASAVKESLTNVVFDTWSDSQIKEWADKNGIKVPQGIKRNELLALARKYRAMLYGDTISASASSAYGAATSKAGNEFAKATEDASLKKDALFDSIVSSWTDSRLKAYLDARGVPIPQNGKRDELLAKVRLHKHKAATGWTAWTFDTWTKENLKNWLVSQNNKAAEEAGASRDELVKQAQNAFVQASKAGGARYASVTSYLASATDSVKGASFDTWSDSELKSYLDSYGVPTYQGSKMNELKAAAKKHATYFHYGTSSPSETLWFKLKENVNWAFGQLKLGVGKGQEETDRASDYASEKVERATSKAKGEL